MSKTLRVPEYLGHILEAIQRIEEYISDVDEMAFLNNTLVQDAVIRNIEVIGEASNNIQKTDPAFAIEHEAIPWPVMYAMRNRVAHGYHAIDMETVWITIQRDLPEVYEQIKQVRATLQD